MSREHPHEWIPAVSEKDGAEWCRICGKQDHGGAAAMTERDLQDAAVALNPIRFGTITRKKHRHVWGWSLGIITGAGTPLCVICRKPKDDATSRRGRLNRSRGNAIERYVCRLLGIRRVGQYGGLEDGGGSDDAIVVQVKSGGAFQAALLSKIHTVPVRGDQLRAWVTVSTPGAGHRREGVISFDLNEWAQWHGKGMPADEAEEDA